MTTSTIFAIILALFLGMAIMLAVRLYYRSDNILRKNQALNIRLNANRDANIDPDAVYMVQRVVTDRREYMHINGCWGVCRRTTNRGYMFATTIKVFTDEDDDFNKREAEELCEILNSK